MPTSLLDLPNELLEQIVQLALTYDKPPTRLSSGPIRGPCVWATEGTLSFVELRAEPSEIARRRLDLVPCSLRLDVILANETDLLPTWCFLSKVCRRVDDLTATFRIIGTSPTLEGRRQRFRPGYGTPPPILWSFYYILERFLEVGPLAEHRLPTASPRSKRMPFSINRLNLDFVSSKDGTVAPIRIGVFDWMNGIDNEDDVESCAWSYSDLASWLMRPEWLAEFISGYIRYLLRMGDRAELHGAMMYEYVGSIRICVDGNLLEEYRLDYILKDLNLTYGADETRRNSFVRWKAKAYRVRQEAGLPVIF